MTAWCNLDNRIKQTYIEASRAVQSTHPGIMRGVIVHCIGHIGTWHAASHCHVAVSNPDATVIQAGRNRH